MQVRLRNNLAIHKKFIRKCKLSMDKNYVNLYQSQGCRFKIKKDIKTMMNLVHIINKQFPLIF